MRKLRNERDGRSTRTESDAPKPAPPGRRRHRHPRRPSGRRQDQPRRDRSPGRWAASSCASPSAASATRRRSAATGAPTSGRSPGASCKAITEAGTMNPVVLLDEVDKLGVGGVVGRPDRGAARGARPGAEPHLPRPLPRARPRPVRGGVHRHRQRARHRARRRCSTGWMSSASTATPTTRRCSSPAATCCPASCERAGLADGELAVDDDTIVAIIRGYTREAGVRSPGARARPPARARRGQGRLRRAARRRSIGEARRRLARPGEGRRRGGRAHRAARGRDRPRRHRPRRRRAVHRDHGVPDGAEGEPGLTLTGQLGDVMKESAQIALNYVRSHAGELAIDPAASSAGSTSTCRLVRSPRTARRRASR